MEKSIGSHGKKKKVKMLSRRVTMRLSLQIAVYVHVRRNVVAKSMKRKVSGKQKRRNKSLQA